MTSRNDITGDFMSTKAASDAYRDGYDRIFGTKKVVGDNQIREVVGDANYGQLVDNIINGKPLDPEFQQILTENAWELYDR